MTHLERDFEDRAGAIPWPNNTSFNSFYLTDLDCKTVQFAFYCRQKTSQK